MQRVAHTASTPKPPVKREPLKQEPLLRIRKKHREQQYQKKRIEQRGPVRIGAAIESRVKGKLCRFTYSILQENRKVNASQNRGK